MVAALSFTLIDESEHFFSCNTPFVECAECQFYTFAHIVVEPLLVDFLKSDAASLVDGFYKPNILIQQVLSHTSGLLLTAKIVKTCE